MGSRLAKPPPPDRPVVQPKGKSAQYPRPFPSLTPQSYLPGGAGAGVYPGYSPTGGPTAFPMVSPNSYFPQGTMEPPIMNYSGPTGMLPPPSPFPSMMAPPMSSAASFLPPPMPYPNQRSISMMGPPQPGTYDPGLRSYSRRPVRICRRRRRHRSRRCRPVIRVVESSSCSSISSCSTVSSCPRRRHRSHSHSRRCDTAPPQQPQQPIILLPVPMQQSQQSIPAPVTNSIQQQPQQIVLPPIQVQQPGSFQPQQLALSGIPIQQQQQQLALPPIQLNSSNFIPSTNSSPIIIPSGQPLLQSSTSLPQIVSVGQTQPVRGGAIQYVRAAPSSSSPLQYVTSDRRSTKIPQRTLVNSTNKNQSSKRKPVGRSTSVRDIAQNDLKFGRRPFDWYDTDKKTNVINEKIQVGQRGSVGAR